jgi:hypothetical protein
MAWTRADGWVWVFCVVDHYTAEAWAHVAKVGDRFAALQPVYDAVTDRWAASTLTSPAAWRCGTTGSSSGSSGMIKLARHLSKKPGAVHAHLLELWDTVAPVDPRRAPPCRD